MKTIRSHVLATAVGALLLASCGPQLVSTSVPMSSAPVSRTDGSLAGTIHAQVNSFRGSKGYSALNRHVGLDRLAQQHSEFMLKNRGKFGSGIAGNLTHYGFEERALAAQRTMSMANVAENVATCSGSGNGSASTMVNAWINSPGHVVNMKGKWDASGIGVVVDSDGTVFATQIFATRNHSHMAMPDRMRQF